MSVEEKLLDLEEDVKEMRSLLGEATRTKVKDMLSINLRKLETDLIHLREEKERQESRLNPAAANSAPSIEPKPKASAAKIIPDSQIKDYSWDQSEKFVKLYLTNIPGLSELDQDAVKTNFTDESLEVRIENYKNKNLVFNIYKTCHKINPEKSYHKIKSDYLLVFICKHNPGSNWSHFTYADRMKSDSNKLKSDGKVNDKAGDDPSAGLMDMMKKLYDDGDEEMKRTIAKAWTEGQQKKADF